MTAAPEFARLMEQLMKEHRWSAQKLADELGRRLPDRRKSREAVRAWSKGEWLPARADRDVVVELDDILHAEGQLLAALDMGPAESVSRRLDALEQGHEELRRLLDEQAEALRETTARILRALEEGPR